MGKKRPHETDEERKERKRAKKEEKRRKKEERSEETRDNQDVESHVVVPFSVNHSEPPPARETVFYRKRIELVVSLYPSSLGNVLKSLQESIHAFLLRYSDGVGGVILGLDDLAIISDTMKPTGRILNELPYIHYTVACNALVFNPMIGCNLTGEVNECFPSHIGMLVFSYFNAMVSAEQLRKTGYSFDSSKQQWIHDETGRVVSALDKIEFIVDKVHECGGTISLEGSDPMPRQEVMQDRN